MTKADALKDVKIVIVEDEAIVALDLQLSLEAMGATILSTSCNLDAAEKALATEHFDVALLDVMIGDEEIYPLAKDVLRKEAGVVFHSGHARQDLALEKFPNAKFCQKPCSSEELARAIREAADLADR